MAEEMLFLANLGVEVLRLDAVAFIWKQIGTNSENLPQAHWLIQHSTLFQESLPLPYYSNPKRSSTRTMCLIHQTR